MNSHKKLKQDKIILRRTEMKIKTNFKKGQHKALNKEMNMFQ